MILDKELVGKIKEYFDLNIYETRVWLALLGKGVASAGQISELSDVPRSRTYDVLESLEKKGFAIAKIGKPTQYIAVKPKTVLEKLKRNAHKEAERKTKILEELKNRKEYEKLEELHNSSLNPIKREEVSGALKDSDIYSHAKELAENAKKEIIICMPAVEILKKQRTFKNIFKKLDKEKVEIRLALNGDVKDIKEIHKLLKIKPKKTDLNTKFFIVDREQVIFNLTHPDNSQEMAVWLNSEYFSNALASLFDIHLAK